jgi:hypothetical protein
MNNFDYSNIRSLNLNFNSYRWNSKTHNVTVSHDPKIPGKFSIKLTPIYEEPQVNHLNDATEFLKKFTLNK